MKVQALSSSQILTVETLSYEALSSHGLAVLCGLSIKRKDYMHAFAIGRKGNERSSAVFAPACRRQVETLTNVLKYPT